MSAMPAKVDLAYFSFTEITDPAAHASYNEWHLFDHMPENLALPGIVWAQRWVASPELPDDTTDDALRAAHYVTAYLMTEPEARTLGEFLALGQRLRSLGRFHRQRRALLGGPFRLVKCYAAPRVLVSPDAIPYRPHRGVFVTVADVVGEGRSDDVARWLDDVHLPALLTVPGVAGVWWFQAMPDAASTLPGNPPTRSVQVCWLDDEPATVAPALHAHLARADEDDGGRYGPSTWRPLLRRAFATIDPRGPFDWFAR
jgi:hypothetical protein